MEAQRREAAAVAERTVRLAARYEAEVRRLEELGGYRWTAEGSTSAAPVTGEGGGPATDLRAEGEAAGERDAGDGGEAADGLLPADAEAAVFGGGRGGYGRKGGADDDDNEDDDETGGDGAFIILRDGFSSDEEEEEEDAGGADSARGPAAAAAAAASSAAADAPQQTSSGVAEAVAAMKRRLAVAAGRAAGQGGAAEMEAAVGELREMWAAACPARIRLRSAPQPDPGADGAAGPGAPPRIKYPATVVANVASALSSALYRRYGARDAPPLPPSARGSADEVRVARVSEAVELAAVAANLFRAALGTEDAVTKTAFANWQATQSALTHFVAQHEAAQRARVARLVGDTLACNDPAAVSRGLRLVHRALGRVLDEPGNARFRRVLRAPAAVSALLALRSAPGTGAPSAGEALLLLAGFRPSGDDALQMPAGDAPLGAARIVRACVGGALTVADGRPDAWARRSRAAVVAAALQPPA